jgi:hypothetical protein
VLGGGLNHLRKFWPFFLLVSFYSFPSLSAEDISKNAQDLIWNQIDRGSHLAPLFVPSSGGRLRLFFPAKGLWNWVSYEQDERIASEQVKPIATRAAISGTRGLVYLWSPTLPLSVAGIADVRVVAQEMALPLYVFADPYADPSLVKRMVDDGTVKAEDATPGDTLSFQLLGATQHFPALLVFNDQRFTSMAYVGRRTMGELEAIIHSELKRPSKKFSRQEFDRAIESKRVAMEALPIRELPKAPTEIRSYPLREFGLGNSIFFQVVPKSTKVLDYSYIDMYRVFLIDTRDGGITRLGSTGGDPYPTPDGSIVTVPNREDKSINFYKLSDLASFGSTAIPFYKEARSTWYQSLAFIPGILGANEKIIRMMNRVTKTEVTHYRLSAPVNGSPSLTPIGETTEVCNGIQPAGPILSRDGTKFSAYTDEGMEIYNVPSSLPGECTSWIKIPFRTTKGIWSPDNQYLTFSSNFLPSKNFILNVATKELYALPNTRQDCINLNGPRITDDGSLLMVCTSPRGDRSHVIYSMPPLGSGRKL